MKEWNVKHMQDIVVKYLNGLPDGASRFQRRMYKKYGGVTNVSKTIEYDLKHGATKNDIISFLVTLKTEDSSLPKVLINFEETSRQSNQKLFRINALFYFAADIAQHIGYTNTYFLSDNCSCI